MALLTLVESLRGALVESLVESLAEPVAQSLAGLVWPVVCGGCGAPGDALCAVCGRWSGEARWCPLPGVSDPEAPDPEAPDPEARDPEARDPEARDPEARAPAAPDAAVYGVWAASAYGGAAARLISAWKERGRLDLTTRLAEGLTSAVTAGLDGRTGLDLLDLRSGVDRRVALVPVPTSRAARRRRGADLTADLACRTARQLRGQGVAATVVPALRLRRRVADQAGLGVAERRANLSGAMAATSAVRTLAGVRVVLVDDVVTTGATVREAAKVLVSAGVPVADVCCLSVTLRRHGVSPAEGLH